MVVEHEMFHMRQMKRIFPLKIMLLDMIYRCPAVSSSEWDLVASILRKWSPYLEGAAVLYQLSEPDMRERDRNLLLHAVFEGR